MMAMGLLTRLERFTTRVRKEAEGRRATFEERRRTPRDQWGEGGFNPTITERRQGRSSLTPDVEHALVSARDALMAPEVWSGRGAALDAINEILKRAGYVWWQPETHGLMAPARRLVKP